RKPGAVEPALPAVPIGDHPRARRRLLRRAQLRRAVRVGARARSAEVALMNAASYVWSIVYFGGMLLAFIGERIVGAGTARALTGVGVVVIGAAIDLRAARAARASADRRQVERMLIALYAVGAFAVALY